MENSNGSVVYNLLKATNKQTKNLLFYMIGLHKWYNMLLKLILSSYYLQNIVQNEK